MQIAYWQFIGKNSAVKGVQNQNVVQISLFKSKLNHFLFLFTKEMRIMRIIKNRKYVTKSRIN